MSFCEFWIGKEREREEDKKGGKEGKVSEYLRREGGDLF